MNCNIFVKQFEVLISVWNLPLNEVNVRCLHQIYTSKKKMLCQLETENNRPSWRCMPPSHDAVFCFLRMLNRVVGSTSLLSYRLLTQHTIAPQRTIQWYYSYSLQIKRLFTTINYEKINFFRRKLIVEQIKNSLTCLFKDKDWLFFTLSIYTNDTLFN
jgi:hypothetical protein